MYHQALVPGRRLPRMSLPRPGDASRAKYVYPLTLSYSEWPRLEFLAFLTFFEITLSVVSES